MRKSTKHAIIAVVSIVNSFAGITYCADTNILVVPKGDNRAAAFFFVDECLSHGLTNSISLVDLRKWAMATVEKYQRWELALATSSAVVKEYHSVLPVDIPESIKTIQSRIPSCRSTEAMSQIEGWGKMVEAYSEYWAVSKEEAENKLRTLHPDAEAPAVEFVRSSDRSIKAIAISWYIYGIVVGSESFKLNWEPYYQRKLADGIYLVHGYK